MAYSNFEKPQKLAIIGAGFLQLPLVMKALSMGLETYCFAYEQGAVCKDICNQYFPISITEKEEILKIAKELNVNGVISIASDLAVPTVSFLAEKLGLTGNSIQSSILATNKFIMKNALQKNNILVAKMMYCKSFSEISNNIELTFPVVVKPIDRSGSLGVSFAENDAQLKESIEYAISNSFCQEVIIEEYIKGFEVSVESISINGEHYILSVTDKKTTGTPYFVETEHFQPAKISKDIYEKIRKIVPLALNTLQIRYGASHSELIISKNNEIFVNEIGARMGGDFIGSHLVELSTGYDYVKSVINCSLGIFNKPSVLKSQDAGVFFFQSPEDKNMKLKELKKNNFAIIENGIISGVEKIIRNSNDRFGYLIYAKQLNYE